MNPWPEENSVLVMDNCAIHKMEALRVMVEEAGEYNSLVALRFALK